ncbi:MAG: prepilin peptidase [Leptospirales bacterium]
MSEVILLCFAGYFFSSIISAADSFAERALNAWYRQSRKTITKKWKYVLRARSVCAHCGTVISPLCVIPVAGYFISKGKCKKCKITLPKRYPVQEISAFLYGCVLYYFHPAPVYFVFSLVYMFLIIVIAKIDFEFFLIPHEPIAIFILIGLAEYWFFSYPWMSIAMALVWTSIFALFHILRPSSMGRSDVYYVFALCVPVVFPGGLLLPLIASLMGIIYFAFRWKQESSDLPEGPKNVQSSSTGFLQIKAPFGVFLGAAFLILRLLPFLKV